ncbi:CoA-dependent acyltransferase [Athelia psychrophila]|uniref:CoA-dependent acyltransferase n=1 Tax=Athelia psychrophila TaxID=1759441 RepID=A0A165WIU0_9AGAM|nr:CoA-dependent acyltransferase [Fibularhizoctonia sp. CBS 109695]
MICIHPTLEGAYTEAFVSPKEASPPRKTLDRYLKSIELFLLEGEGRAAKMGRRIRMRPEGQGAGGSHRCKALDKSPASPHNWLDDTIWIMMAYHEWREPPPVNSNWWLTFLNDPALPAHAQAVPPTALQDNGEEALEGVNASNLDASAPESASGIGTGTAGGWERLGWVTDERIERECARVERKARARIADSDDSGLWFTDYSSGWIKDVAKLSPDAYIRMVLQLAWYKIRSEFTATYETALTRMFARGRTETIRTYTTDSRAWVLSTVQGRASKMLLHRAITTHASLTREAATGRGIDRHFLGLRLMLAQQSGSDNPVPLLNDELFQRSQAWKLSTSGLSAGHQFRGTGFGSAYPDGYGINYLAGPDVIKFGETKHASCLTSTEGFKAAIFASLREVHHLCLADSESSHIVSHL